MLWYHLQFFVVSFDCLEWEKTRKIPSFITSILSFYITFESIELRCFRANPCGNAYRVVSSFLPLVLSFVRSNTSKSVTYPVPSQSSPGTAAESVLEIQHTVTAYLILHWCLQFVTHTFLLCRATWTLLNYVVFLSFSALFYTVVYTTLPAEILHTAFWLPWFLPAASEITTPVIHFSYSVIKINRTWYAACHNG